MYILFAMILSLTTVSLAHPLFLKMRRCCKKKQIKTLPIKNPEQAEHPVLPFVILPTGLLIDSALPFIISPTTPHAHQQEMAQSSDHDPLCDDVTSITSEPEVPDSVNPKETIERWKEEVATLRLQLNRMGPRCAGCLQGDPSRFKGVYQRSFGETHFSDYSPQSLAISEDEQKIYVCNYGRHKMSVFLPDGTWVHDFTSVGMKYPWAVAIWNDEIYVSDTGNRCIRVFSLEGVELRKWGLVCGCYALVVSPDGLVFAGDYDNLCIQVFTTHGEHVRELGYGLRPSSMAYSEGKLYVCDYESHVIRVLDAETGTHLSRIGKTVSEVLPAGYLGSPGSGDGELNHPWGVCIKENHVIVADMQNHRIQIFDKTNGKFVEKFGSKGRGDGQFILPVGVATDKQGRLFIADRDNHRIQIFE